MSIDIFSIMMAVLWCNVFTIVLYVFFSKTRFAVYFSISPFIVLTVFSILRLLLNFELPNTRILPSYTIYPAILSFMQLRPFEALSEAFTIQVYELLCLVWIIGIFCSLFRLYIREYRFQKLLSGEPLTGDSRVYSILEKLSDGKPNKLRVVESTLIEVPMVAGFFRPTIYLPKVSLSDTELYYVLLHEWTHYIHKDIWVKLLIRILCAIYWWNPVIYLLKYNIDSILEVKNDLYLTCKLSEEASIDYLQTILSLARKTLTGRTTGSGFAIELIQSQKANLLEQRFHFVLNHKPSGKKPKSCTALLSGVMLLVFIASYGFVLQPNTTPKEVETGEAVFITPDNAYICKNKDGTYILYVNNAYFYTLKDADELLKEPMNLLQIYETED